MTHTTVKIADHAWGRIIVIEHAHALKCIMHPEHHEPLKARGFVCFTDEQGFTWRAERFGDLVAFEGSHGALTARWDDLFPA